MEALEARLAAIESRSKAGQEAATAATPEAPTTSPVDPSDRMPPFIKRMSQIVSPGQKEDCMRPLKRSTLSPMKAELSEILLLRYTVDDVCAELPFLPIPWFLARLNLSDALHITDAWWQGLLNALLACAVFYKTHNRSFRDVAPSIWSFFRNAYATIPELIIQQDCVGAAEAIMAMVIFMRQSADAKTTSMLLSMCIRMIHMVPATRNEDENQRRLIVAAFILDVETAVNTGLPPAHSRQLSSSPAEFYTTDGGLDSTFRAREELARLQYRIASEVASPSEDGLLALESELEAWRVLLPADIQPDCSRTEVHAAGDTMDTSVAILHMVYYNSLCTVCWAMVHHLSGRMINNPGVCLDADMAHTLSEQTKHHRHVARVASRSVIYIMQRFPTHSFAGVWRVLCYPLAASIALLAIICKEPAHPDSKIDVLLLSRFAKFLDIMVVDEGCDLERIRDGLLKFEKVASHAVDAALSSAMPVHPAMWPLIAASGQTGKAISVLMACASLFPMYLAQSLLGNMHNRDTKNAKMLAEMLEIPWGDDGYGPFVPETLVPARWGFTFRQ